MEFSAIDIASVLEGRVEGDADVKVKTLSKIEEGKPGSISFLSNLKYESHLYDTNASIVIVSEGFVPKQSVKSTLIYVEDAYQAFTRSEERRVGKDCRYCMCREYHNNNHA